MTRNTSRLSIRSTLAAARERKSIALMPFVAAGFPDLASTAAVLPALEAGGASMIEIGFPFSDPIADGPTIQAAFTEALAKGIRIADTFRTVASVRAKVSIPLVAMLSYSIVFRYGVERFVKDAKTAGFDGLILPDLPPPEAQAVCDLIRNGGLDTVLLVAPTTTPQRRKEILNLCSGFAYYLSVSGITGERDRLPEDVTSNVRSLKELGGKSGDTPVCVGFGIHRAEQVAQLAGVADGAIVGSAFIKRMREAAPGGTAAVAESAETYCRELLRLVR
jgi:tryptophan synthase alpha chain